MGILSIFKGKNDPEKIRFEKAKSRILSELDGLIEQELSLNKITREEFDSVTDPLKWSRENQERPSNKTDRLRTYKKYVWSYAPTYAIASSAASVPFKIFRKKSNGEKGDLVTNGPAHQLFSRPSKGETFYDLLEAFVSYADLIGDSFILKNRAIRPTEMWILRPDFVTIRLTHDGQIKGLIYHPGVETSGFDGHGGTKFPIEEIIHLKYFNPTSDLYGQGFLDAVESPVVLDLDAIQYQKGFFKRGGMFPFYVQLKERLNEMNYKRLKQELGTFHQGVNTSFSVPLLNANGEFKTLGIDNDKAQLTTQRETNRDQILAAAGVPPIMVGLLDAATFNNTQEQKKAFWENTMSPKLRKIENVFNMGVLDAYQMVGEFDLSGVPALGTGAFEKSEIVGRLVRATVFTPNELRERFYNTGPREGGDEFPTAGPPGAQSESSPTEKSVKKRNALITSIREITKRIAVSEFTVGYNDAVKKMDPVMKKRFLSMQDLYIDNYGRRDLEKIRKAESTNDIIKEVLVGTNKELEKMINDVTEFENDISTDFVKDNYKRMNGAVIPEVVEGNVLKSMNKNIDVWALEASDSIVKTMAERTKLFLTKAIKQKLPFREVHKGIRDIFQGTDRGSFPWSRMITRTEMLKIGNSSRFETMKASGFVQKIWVHSGKVDLRTGHLAAEGQGPIGINERFNNGLLYPGDPSVDVGELANCGCSLVEFE